LKGYICGKTTNMAQGQNAQPDIDQSWIPYLGEQFEADYFNSLKQSLQEEKQNGYTVYPRGKEIFRAFNETPFDQVKVVIIGQDPYHGPKQANGLCFSVHKGIKFPPSLMNIFHEIQNDLGINIPPHGDLEKWSHQGVLLLNAMLTVRAGEAGSHRKLGWENFTNGVIEQVSQQKEGVIFMLWGKFAQEKQALINEDQHFILEAPHPSPFSANRGFFGCGHFSKANEILKSIGRSPVDWKLD